MEEIREMYIQYWKSQISDKALQHLLNTWGKDRYWFILLEEKLRRVENMISIRDEG